MPAVHEHHRRRRSTARRATWRAARAVGGDETARRRYLGRSWYRRCRCYEEVGLCWSGCGRPHRKRNAAPEASPAAPRRQAERRRRAVLAVAQAKLTVGAVSDPYEREADHVADRVMKIVQRMATQPDSDGRRHRPPVRGVVRPPPCRTSITPNGPARRGRRRRWRPERRAVGADPSFARRWSAIGRHRSATDGVGLRDRLLGGARAHQQRRRAAHRGDRLHDGPGHPLRARGVPTGRPLGHVAARTRAHPRRAADGRDVDARQRPRRAPSLRELHQPARVQRALHARQHDAGPDPFDRRCQGHRRGRQGHGCDQGVQEPRVRTDSTAAGGAGRSVAVRPGTAHRARQVAHRGRPWRPGSGDRRQGRHQLQPHMGRPARHDPVS